MDAMLIFLVYFGVPAVLIFAIYQAILFFNRAAEKRELRRGGQNEEEQPLFALKYQPQRIAWSVFWASIVGKRRDCMRLRPYTLFLVVTLLCFILLGCKRQENTTSYKVVDSGAWTYPEGLEKTFWLDNERVLFVSDKTLAPGAGPTPKILTIWNPNTGEINFSHQLTHLICVQDGQVFFAAKDEATGKRKYYRGPLDNPQEYPVHNPNMRIDDRFDCDWVPESSRANVPYKIKLKDDNYLEIVKDQRVKEMKFGIDYGKARYYERLDKAPTPLPMDADLGDYTTRFNQLRNAYFISPTQYFPNDPYFHSLWWLQRNGTITEEPLPIPLSFVKPLPQSQAKGYIYGGVRFYPLRDGYLIHSNAGKINYRGLYLMKGQKIEKVLLGAIHGVSISPDECRAAFIHAKNTEEYLSKKKPYRTVKTINFCEGGNKS